MFLFFFFFKQKTAYEMRISDWSSDVCSSDLLPGLHAALQLPPLFGGRSGPLWRSQPPRYRAWQAGMARAARRAAEQEDFPYTIRVLSDITESNGRSEERRVGKGCVRTGRSRWAPDH